MTEQQSKELPEKPKNKKTEDKMIEELLNEKELNQGTMLVKLGENKVKTLFDELPDCYSCKFLISPPDEKYSDYFCIFNYKKKMQIAFIGVPDDTKEGDVIIRPVLKNINKLTFEEKLVVIAMLSSLSDDLDIPIDREIKI